MLVLTLFLHISAIESVFENSEILSVNELLTFSSPRLVEAPLCNCHRVENSMVTSLEGSVIIGLSPGICVMPCCFF